MNISAPFIKRPVMTTLVMIAVLVFGILSYKVLPVGMLPNVEYPTIAVSVGYPGARPQTMSTTCAVPLEREFMTIEGIKTITSSSTLGGTSIVMQFNLDRSLDSASIDVEAAINRAIPNLPSDLPYNPTYRKVNTSDSPIYYLALTSDNMTLSELYDYGNTYLGKKMAVIEGVSQVQTFGAPYAARIQIDTERLASIGMSLDEISLAIREGNVELPTGNLFGPKTEFTLDVDGQLLNAKAFNNLVVKAKDGSIVKIDQIGEAKDSLENDKYYLHYLNKTTNKPCILLAVRKQPGKNTVAVVKKIKKELPRLKSQLPKSLEYHNIFDQSDIIQDAVLDVEITLIIAFILVVAVIFLSLGKLMHTIILIII